MSWRIVEQKQIPDFQTKVSIVLLKYEFCIVVSQSYI